MILWVANAHPCPKNDTLKCQRNEYGKGGQTFDSQLEQLRAVGCTAKIYREKVTGAHNVQSIIFSGMDRRLFQTLKAILNKLRPEPAHPPLPPLKVYEPPSKGQYKRRG
jgi:hypothetical protein